MTKAELKQNWINVLDYLKSKKLLDEVVIDTFLSVLTPKSISQNEGMLYLTANENSPFYQSVVKNHQEDIIKATEAVFNMPLIVQVLDAQLEEDEPDEQQKEDCLNPKYTFASFVQGPTNRMACAASMAVADGFTKTYNPLFIYADSGLGKTHLMHAICHFVKQNKPKKKVLYVSAETFMSELSESIRLKKQNQFKDKYRKVDYLLLDDVQFIAGKGYAEEELFNTFETLYNNKKQMVFTSDKPPKELGGFPERISSRFIWGVMVDIQKPDYETRMAILKNKAVLENLEITDELVKVFDLIAQNINNNIRELEGAFTRVLAFSKLSDEEITLELSKKILSDVIKTPSDEITPDKIKKTVASYYGIKVSDLDSSKRSREISYPRHIAIYLIRELLNLSYPAIGKIFSGKDHTSIMHSYEVISEELKVSSELQNIIDNLKKKLY